MEKKLIIFDLDGVLVTTKDLHYKALNKALEKIDKSYIVNYEEHIATYDGLPTYKKLEILHEKKGLPLELASQINASKQEETFSLIDSEVSPDYRLIEIFKQLKEDKYIIYVASNSIRKTVKLILLKLGLIEYVDNYFSNEDVKYSKPHPEMFLKCIIDSGALPKNTLIVEDSPRGIEAALNSKCNLLIVKNPNDVTYDKIINKISKQKPNNMEVSELTILVPMAGKGSRFEQAGYAFPKPLIDIKNKPMIQLVVDSLNINAHFVYIVRKDHYEKYNLKHLLNLVSPNCDIIPVDEKQYGAASTTLLAKEYINNDTPLLIANSDQYIKWNPMDFFYLVQEKKADGGILTFEASHPKWSYVTLDEENYVNKLAEKTVISNIATVGIYWYAKGSEYVKYAEQMIEKEIKLNGEYYVAPVYNEYLLDNKKIVTFDVNEMWGLGTPEDLELFLKYNYDKI